MYFQPQSFSSMEGKCDTLKQKAAWIRRLKDEEAVGFKKVSRKVWDNGGREKEITERISLYLSELDLDTDW